MLYLIVVLVLVATICMTEAAAIDNENSSDFLNNLRTKRDAPCQCNCANNSCRCHCPIEICRLPALRDRCELVFDDDGIIISDYGCEVVCDVNRPSGVDK